ncbi:MAG: hypothetical protein E6R03_03460 [Hyphomicrobiaceae bacterium]|nr:MAG: hypothetical protein E6R03_03460 [Hyphomicrobiaceae bacterium]
MSDWKAIAEPYCHPGTLRYYFADGLRIDLEHDPWSVLDEDGTGRPATTEEIAAVQAQLLAKPILKPLSLRREVYNAFSDMERTAIRTSAPEFSERLALADEPIPLDLLIPYFQQLLAGGLLTSQRFTALTGITP